MTAAPALVLPYLIEAELALLAAMHAAEGQPERREQIASLIHQTQSIIRHHWTAEKSGQP